jgi:tRNA(Ile)-lysidine synthase
MASWPMSSPTRRCISARPWSASASAPAAPEPPPRPLGDAAFAALIEPLGPFERPPELAVAVSGGPDSLALCLLARRWAEAHGGRVVALTVDHRLRPDSAAEAAAVASWLATLGICHHVLVWEGGKPTSGIQAAAREARYRLLGDWCRRADVLHLLLGHQREDQAETVALRAARGSGPDGLAAMAPVREMAGLRLLRPLLPVPRAALQATLAAAGQPWLEDPSNRAPSFARTRLRGAARLDVDALVAKAGRAGHRRAANDDRLASWLAAHARADPAGFVTLEGNALRCAPTRLVAPALRRALAAVGVRIYPPRSIRLARLLAAARAQGRWRDRTLAGCRILLQRGVFLVAREPAAIGPEVRLDGNTWQRWDGRFVIRVGSEGHGLTLRALGEHGWRQRHELAATGVPRRLPAAVRPGLPSLWRDGQLLAVPHLNLMHPDLAATGFRVDLRLRPLHPLAGARFAPMGDA